MRLDAHVRLAAIVEDQLEEPVRALPHLTEVLNRNPNHPTALLRMVRIELKRDNHVRALELARRLVGTASTDGERVAALVQVAHIEDARGHLDEKARVLTQAIELDGPDGEAAGLYRRMVEAQQGQASWEVYVKTLTDYLERTQSTNHPLGSCFRAIAQVMAETFQLPRDAVAVLRRGVEREPGDCETRLHLAQRLNRLGEHGEAITELRRLLSHSVSMPAAWRELSRALHAAGEAREAALAAQPLILLGAATPNEQETLQKRRPRAAQAPLGFFGPERIRKIEGRTPHDATTVFVQNLSAVFAKLYPGDPKRFGVGRRERLTNRATSPLRDVAERIAEVLGIQAFDLYVHPRADRDIGVELGPPATLFVPQWAEQLSEPGLTFLLARPLVNIARDIHAFYRVPTHELAILLAAAVRDADPMYETKIVNESVLEEKAKLVSRFVPRRSRKTIKTAADDFAARPADVEQWIAQMEQTAARVALLIADDLIAAINVVQRTTGETIQSGTLPAELMRFWVSAQAGRIRQKLASG